MKNLEISTIFGRVISIPFPHQVCAEEAQNRLQAGGKVHFIEESGRLNFVQGKSVSKSRIYEG